MYFFLVSTELQVANRSKLIVHGSAELTELARRPATGRVAERRPFFRRKNR